MLSAALLHSVSRCPVLTDNWEHSVCRRMRVLL